MRRISERFRQCGLEIHPGKSSIVYCKDDTRSGDYSGISVDFLGYTFRPRRSVDPQGRIRTNFLPAISRDSMKEINRRIRSWHIQLRSDKALLDFSRILNPILRGWYIYYGRFYPSALGRIWDHFNRYLVRWVRRKYKRFFRHKRRARRYLARFARTHRDMFIHWRLGVFP
jgi:RNA-directed DNA polymerase